MIRERGSIAGLVGSVLCIDSVFYAAIVPILGRLSHEFTLSKSQAGLLVGAYAAAMAVGAYPAAKVVVRWKGRRCVLAGLGVMSAGCLVFAFSESLSGLVIARALQGMGGTLSWTGGLAWLAERTPPGRRGQALGTALGAGVFGSQLGPVMGSLVATVGRTPVFSTAALAGALLAGWALTVPASAAVDAEAGSAPVRRLRDRKFGAGLWLTAVPSACLGVVDVLSPLRLTALGETPLVIGAIFFTAAGLLAIASRLTGQAIDRFGIILPVRVALLGSIGSLAVLSVASDQLPLALAIVLGSAFLGSLWGPGMYLLSGAAQSRGVDEGYAFAAFLFAWAVGFTAGSTSSGVLAVAGGENMPYRLASALCFVTGAIALRSSTRGSHAGAPRAR